MNLLIVDDEPLIHRSIDYCLGELKETDVTALHAYNGTEMQRLMEAQPVQAALVDIRMPGMSGLDAISGARGRWPDVDYYIMSGFSEFEYARKAIELGVTEYLLKPLSPEDLSHVLLRAREKQSLRLRRVRETFRAWLTGGLHRHDVDDLYVPQYYTGIVLLTCDSPKKEAAEWLPECASLDREDLISLPCWEGTLLLSFSPDPAVIHTFLNRFPRKDLPEGVTVFVSSASRDSGAALKQLHRLLDASPLRALYGIGVRYDLALLPEASEEEASTASQLVALRDACQKQDYQAYSVLHLKLRRGIKALPARRLEAAVHFASCVFGKEIAPSFQALLDELKAGEEFLLGQQKRADKVDAILSYIDQHYCDDLSIASLAAMYDFTPNYLSTLLKNRQGIKFTDYLTHLRIKRAKELLLTSDLSVKEIASQVGYHSQSHFTRLFMESEVYAPLEFRRRFGNLQVPEAARGAGTPREDTRRVGTPREDTREAGTPWEDPRKAGTPREDG